jgi:hypothetical protein
MHNLILRLAVTITIATCLGSSTTWAQSFFNSNANSGSGTTAASASKSVLSADEFKNAVNTMGQQTQSTISQQAKQQFSKPLQQPAVAAPSMNNVQPSEMNPSAPNTSYSTPPPTTAHPTQLPSGYSGTSSAPAYAPPPPPPAPPTNYGTQNLPSQNQPYTGFGGANSNNKGAPSPPPSNGGGWNIKY